MRIGLISDTHDHLENIARAFEFFAGEKIKLICHAGDWVSPYAIHHTKNLTARFKMQLRGVLGNNEREIHLLLQQSDARFILAPSTLSFRASKRKIILYHGTDAALLESLVRSGKHDVVISGHTHIPRLRKAGQTLHINPGTAGGYKPGRRNSYAPHQIELAIYDSVAHHAKLITI
jgi:hypothetical protein